MDRRLVAAPVVAALLVMTVACGSVEEAGTGTPAPPTVAESPPAMTITAAGLLGGVVPAPRPLTRQACVARWNGASNDGGRAAAAAELPRAVGALVGTANAGDHVRRCQIIVFGPSERGGERGREFVEKSRGRYVALNGTGGTHPAPHADVGPGHTLTLRP